MNKITLEFNIGDTVTRVSETPLHPYCVEAIEIRKNKTSYQCKSLTNGALTYIDMADIAWYPHALDSQSLEVIKLREQVKDLESQVKYLKDRDKWDDHPESLNRGHGW